MDPLLCLWWPVAALVQASHDAHGTVLDGIEDRLTSHEIKSAASLVSLSSQTTPLSTVIFGMLTVCPVKLQSVHIMFVPTMHLQFGTTVVTLQ